MDEPHPEAVLDGDLPLRGRGRADREAEHIERPRGGIGERRQGGRLGAGEVGDQRRPDRAPPLRRLVQDRRHDQPARLLEPFDGVHRTQHLGEIGAGTVEVEAQIVGVADHPVPAAGEPVTVDLEPVSQARLHDSVAALDLVDQAVHIGMQLVVDAVDVTGDDGAEQQPTEAGRRVDGEDEVAERQAPGRDGGSRVPHLELGEQHAW